MLTPPTTNRYLICCTSRIYIYISGASRLDGHYFKGNFLTKRFGHIFSFHTHAKMAKFYLTKLQHRGRTPPKSPRASPGLRDSSCHQPLLRHHLLEGQDLNPLGYHVWMQTEETPCTIPHCNSDALMASVKQKSAAMPGEAIMTVCCVFRGHLEACIAAEGGTSKKERLILRH